MLGIIVALLVLSLVIIIHEFGHFLAARKAGILCHEFSLGMGPVLWSKKVGETTYAIRAIPLGGYVAMAGEEVEDELVKVGSDIRVVLEGNVITKIILDHTDERFEDKELITVEKLDLKGIDNVELFINEYEVKRDAFYVLKNQEIQIAPADRNFNYKNKKQRFLAIFGGPFMNFVLAFFVFILFGFLQGFPNEDSAIIGSTTENMPAYEILLEGDEILEINGVSVESWTDETADSVSSVLDQFMGDRMIEFTILRDGVEITKTVTPIIYFYTVGFHTALEGSINDLVVGEIPEGTQAYEAGMKQFDQIVSIDGTQMFTWTDVINKIESFEDGRDFTMVVSRDGSLITLSIKEPWELNVIEKQGLTMVDSLIGISPEYSFSFGKSIAYGFIGIKNSAMMIKDTLSLLFGSSQVGVSDLAGPIGIYQITNNALKQGFVSLLGWIGLLSVNLGVINLLPIPALDGGRLVFLGAEAVGDKVGFKISTKFENRLHYLMYLLLLGLFVFITYNDIIRLIKSIF